MDQLGLLKCNFGGHSAIAFVKGVFDLHQTLVIGLWISIMALIGMYYRGYNTFFILTKSYYIYYLPKNVICINNNGKYISIKAQTLWQNIKANTNNTKG